MRDCMICHLRIGDIADISSTGSCDDCKAPVSYSGHATYLGLKGTMHYFRVHRSFRCSECGNRKMYICAPCGGGGYSEEFEQEISKLFNIPQHIRKD